MLEPTIIDELIAHNTADALRDLLLHFELTAEQRECVITAIYYMEGTENND